MHMQQLVIKTCYESLVNGQADIEPSIRALFFDPNQHNYLMRMIIYPPVAFMYCIHIRKRLNKECHYSYNPTNDEGDRKEGASYSLHDMLRIAESTRFAQELRKIMEKSFSRENRREEGPDETTAKNKKKTGLSKDASSQSEMWYESLIFIELLICSKEYAQIHTQEPNQYRDLLPSLIKFRMEMLARLLINVLDQMGSDSISCQAFQEILKTMIDLSGRDEVLSIQEMLMMAQQLMRYIKQEDQIRSSKRFTKFFGKYMMRMLMQSLKRLLNCPQNIPKVIQRAFNAIDEYISILSILKDKRNPLGILKKPNENDDQADLIQGKVYNSDIFIHLHFDFVKNALLFIDKRDLIIFDDTFQKCLEIVDKITLVSHLAGQDNNVRQQIYSTFQANVGLFMKKILEKWFNPENIRQDNNQQHFFQALVINILSNILNNCVFTPMYEHLLMSSLAFCHQIVNKIPIRVSLGDRSIISIMFYYLRDIFNISKRLQNDSQAVIQIRRITQSFIQVCSGCPYDNISLSMQEDVETCEMFFDPVIQLMQKLYTLENRLLPDNHFTTIRKYAYHLDSSGNSPQKTTILEILMIELVKNIESFKDSQSYKTKCILIFDLLKNYESSTHIPHLMLLSAIADQIINEESSQIGDYSIYFWFYVDQFTNHTVASIMEMLSSEVVAYLVKGNSLYLGKYAIHILNRLCSQLKQVQTNKKCKQGLMVKQYLAPIVSYVNNLHLTVLKSIDSYQQRQKLLELICQIAVSKIQDVYDIYAAIRPKFEEISDDTSMKFVIDMGGVLSFNNNQEMEEVFLQLILHDLRENPNIIEMFTLSGLQDDVHMDIYTQFVLKVLQKLEKITMYKKEDSLTTDFQVIFHRKLDILSEVYSQSNFSVIHQIWQAFMCLDKMNLVFPKIPNIIYKDKVIGDVIDWLFRHLTRLPSIQSVKTLYLNTFERKSMPTETIDSQLMRSVAYQQNYPEYLFLLADYLDFSGEGLFFDHESAVECELIKIYREVCYSSKTYDYFCMDSDSQQEDTDLLKVLQMPDNQEHKKKMNYIMKAAYIFDFVTKREERTFVNFRDQVFLEKLKTINNKCKIH